MKVVSPKQMAHLESQAYRDGSLEEDFMEEAGSGVALYVQDYVEKYDLDRRVVILVGKGNNGGDALTAGTHLLHLEYLAIAYLAEPLEKCSPLCQQNYRRFLNEGGRIGTGDLKDDLTLNPQGIILDGFFGTGFHGEVKEPYASMIAAANESGLPIIAVDIPSGLNGETGEEDKNTIRASETCFLGLPKTGFFLRSGWDYVGKLRYVDFGLPPEYISESEADLIMLDKPMLAHTFPLNRRAQNKYDRGSVAGVAGSPGMPGAAVMSSLAALKSGAGIVHLYYPEEMKDELNFAPYELIKVPISTSEPEKLVPLLNKASAIFIGPGLGRSRETAKFLSKIAPKIFSALIVDADALFHFAKKPFKLPETAIFTPHSMEMARLLGNKEPSVITPEYLQQCQAFADEHRLTLVLKGGPTFIFHPGEKIRVNPKGDPGMATAGAGDVLTGVITALTAEGLTGHAAASLGVFIHGLAGEHAADYNTSYCMTATDLLTFLPEGFLMNEL